MKTIAIFIFLAIFMSDNALANKAGEREQLNIDALIVQIKLDKSRTKQFKEIMEQQKKEMQALREQKRKEKQGKKHKMTREEREEFYKQREARHDARDEELLTVLTYEQLYKFKKYMRQFRRDQRMKTKRPQPRNEGQGQQ